MDHAPKTEVQAPAPSETSPGEAWPEVMTMEQASRYLQFHVQVMYRHVRAGTLPASRIGRTIRFKKSVLDAFLERSGWDSVSEFLAFKEKRAGSRSPVSPASLETAAPPARKKRFSAEVD